MFSLFSGSFDRDRQGFGIGPVCPYNLHYFVHKLSTGSLKESVFPIIRMIHSAKYMPRKIAKSFSSKAIVNKEVFQKGVRGQKREVPNEASKYRQKYFNSTSLKTLSNSVFILNLSTDLCPAPDLPNCLLKEYVIAGCSKMPRCKAPEILTSEAYLGVRRNEEGVRGTPQMGAFQHPA